MMAAGAELRHGSLLKGLKLNRPSPTVFAPAPWIQLVVWCHPAPRIVSPLLAGYQQESNQGKVLFVSAYTFTIIEELLLSFQE